MRTAKIVVLTVAPVCPHCGGIIPHGPTGSEFWEAEDLMQGPEQATCLDCNAEVKLPKPKTVRMP